jgi:predicted Zn-dependent peptidase
MRRFKTMKTQRPFLAVLAALLLLPSAVLGAKKWEKIKTPELRPIQVPEVHRQSLANGMQLFLLEDAELPLFRMTLVMKVGDAYAPKDKVGLAGVTAEVLRSGGSVQLGGDQLDELLEGRGASIEASTDNLTTTIRVNVLAEDTQRVLEIVRELLMRPAFPEDKIELALKQYKSVVARRNDDPSQIADREFNKLLWGANHPFVYQMEYEHLANISRTDLVAFHQKYYQPTDAFVAVWGDFQRNEMVNLLNQTLGAWPKKAVQHPKTPDTPEVQKSVNVVVKESVTQSNIRLGHRSIKRDDPDYYPLRLMNEVLSGGIGSRLFNEVRTRQGLAYRVGSGLGADLATAGMFRVVCGTKSETTAQATRACLAEIVRMRDEPITEEELKRAKDALLNSHVFRFANKGAIVNRQMSYVLYGYPANLMDNYTAMVEAVTVADIQRAAGNFLKPENMALLVVGKPDDFDEQLSAFGEVNEIDITIPEPPAMESFPAPTAETLAKGEEVMAAATAAAGGIAAFDNVSNVTESVSLTINAMGMSMDAKATKYVQLPGNYRMEIAVMGQEMVQMYSRDQKSGFIKGMGGTKDLGEAEMQDFEDGLAREIVVFMRDFEDYRPQFLGEEKVDGVPANAILMTPPTGARKFKLLVDPSSNLIVKMEYRSKDMQGSPVHQEEFLSSWKTVGAIKLPHKAKILQDGKPFLESDTTAVSVKDAIPAEKFAKVES